jgi:hypothetical protein
MKEMTKKMLVPFALTAVLVAAIFVQSSNIRRQTVKVEVGAGTYNAEVRLVPEKSTLPPDTAFLVWMDSKGSDVAYVKFVLNFNPSLLEVTSQFSVTPTDFRIVKLTELTVSNMEGAIEVVLALDPTASPANGIFELGRIDISSNTTEKNVNTGLVFNASSMQIVHPSGTEYSVTVRNADITLNPEVSPTPTLAQSPDSQPNTVQPSRKETLSGTSTGSSVSVSGVSGVNGDLYLAAISTKGFSRVNSITGLGLDWTRVSVQCAGRNQTMVEVWRALGNASSGTVTAQLDSTPKNSAMVVSRYTDVDSTSPVGSVIRGNTKGMFADCSGGTDSQSYNYDIFTTPPVVVFAAIAHRMTDHVPGSVFSETAEIYGGSGGDGVGLSVMDRGVSNSTKVPVTGTFSSNVDWAVVGVEIRGR